MEHKQILVEAIGLHKEYGEGDGKTVALNDVSLSIYDGELLVILGSSGSGKSTLLNLLGGMDKADNGSIYINGSDLCQMNDRELTKYRRNTMGFVFQSFNLIPELTAAENVGLVSTRPAAVNRALKSVGLAEKKNKYPAELSGGEQQRVSIARALAKHPKMLLCDEPTGALDYKTGRQILKVLEQTCREGGHTVVFVTHTREIAKMADRVLYVRNGAICDEVVNDAPLSADEIEW